MANEKGCRVSILMPTYDYGRYIGPALESVLAQTFRDFELLVVDNCSTDDTAPQVERYAARDARVRYIKNESNLGMVGNWNRCLSHARGTYVKFLFSDDTLLTPDALERMVDRLDRAPSTALVVSSRAIINADSARLGVMSYSDIDRVRDGRKVIKECMLEQKNRIGEPSSVLFRRKHSARGFDTRYRQIVDLEMWFHLLEQGDMDFIHEPLVSFRVHPEQQTQQNTGNQELVEEPFLLLEEYEKKPYLHLRWYERCYMRFVPLYSVWKQYWKHGRITRSEALKVIGKRYGLASFLLTYPLFKICKIYRRSLR